jgi:general secretion pathway protein C
MTVRQQVIGANSLKIWYFLLCAVLSLLLAQTSAALTWKIVGLITGAGESVVMEEGNRPKPPVPGKIPASSRMIVSTEEFSLFGKAGKVERSSQPQAFDSKVAPTTTLALVLKGIISMEPMDRALAVIAEKGKDDEEKLYGLGDKVPGDAVISEILADRIILRRGGVLETLMLQTEEGITSAGKPVGRLIGGDDDIVNLGDGVHWEIDSSYLNQRLNDIPSLAREIGVEVYKEGNVQKGYRLVSARGSKLLRDMGLQPGDILHEVNGVQLDTISAGLSVYQQMRNTQQIRAVISRNGRRETRIYEINNGG